ncbi:MAG: hypothetical protein LVR00_09680 [Rhabdochlamydiaceae bacterium]|jgi:hypothetical protein
MKINETDPDQRKKRQQRAEAAEKKKTDTTLSQGSKIHRAPPGSLDSFAKKTQKIEKAGESEKRQPKQQKKTAEEIEADSTTISQPSKVEKPFDSSLENNKQDNAISSKKSPPPEPVPVDELLDIEESERELEIKQTTPKNTPKKQQPKPVTVQMPLPSTPVNTPNLLASSSGIAPAYASLKPEMFALFERLLGSMSVMNTSGISETTIELNAAEFSTFAGAKIVIREHSTAPKSFNIEFLGNAETVALFSNSMAGLVAAFKHGEYAFQVNRIDASLLKTERPHFHRKESTKDKKEKDEGQDA